MSQDATDKDGDFIFPYGKTNQTIVGMTKFAVAKAQIAREEGRIVEWMQKGDDLFVLHPLSTNINTDLMDWNSPALQ